MHPTPPAQAALHRPARTHRLPTSRQVLPTVPSVGALVVSAYEVTLGLRAPQQLASVLHPEVFATLSLRRHLTARGASSVTRATSSVRFVQARLCETAAAVEAAVVVAVGARHRAAAVRLEQLHGRWRAVALLLG